MHDKVCRPTCNPSAWQRDTATTQYRSEDEMLMRHNDKTTLQWRQDADLEDFWRHVVGRAHHGPSHILVVTQSLADAKVPQLDNAMC